MKLDKAVKEAKKLDEVDEILSSGGFLCSAYILMEKDKELDEWNLAFYSKDKDEITAVKVKDSKAELGVTDSPLREDTGKIDVDKVKIGAKDALEKIKSTLEEEFSVSYEKILFTLKKDERQEWRAVFVGKSLSIVSIAVDTETGEVVEKERKSLGAGKSFGG